MRLIFLGTPDFGVPSLRALVRAGHEVAAVVTQPDRPAGRGKKLKACPLKQAAQLMGLPVLSFERIRAPENVAQLEALRPDVMVTAAYGQILNNRVLGIAPRGVVNVHGSLLPRYRGPAPIQWALINGERVTGITTMLTERGVDSGPILLQRELNIREEETAETLFARLADLGAEVLLETLAGLEAGTLTPRPQEEEAATYYPMLDKEAGRLDWSQSAQALSCRVRGVTPWPGAWTTLAGQVLKMGAVQVEPGAGQPGEVVLSSPKDGLVVATGAGCLRLLTLQLPGKKAMSASDLLRGHPIPVGALLGEDGA